jgi:hypothetical protein
VTATALLALCCCAAARTAGGCGIGGGGYGGDAATRAGKWLPYAGAVGGGYPHNHLPSAFWAQRPGDGAFEGGGGGQEEELVRLREQSYERGESERTKQEQLAMWASLLNPKGKRSGCLPGEETIAGEETADQGPAKTSDGAAAEGTELDDPAVGGLQVGQTNSGLYWRNIRS